MVFWGVNIFGTIDLQRTIDEVKTLRAIIPICLSCQKIRDGEGLWNQIETYIKSHSEAEFSHSICLDRKRKLYQELPKRV